MKLNVNEVNDCLQTQLGTYEDCMQEAWLEIIKCYPETFDDVALITRKVKKQGHTKVSKEEIHGKELERSHRKK